MTYRDRREAKAARLRGWADSNDAKSAAALGRAREIADMIPFGQPILVGHHSEGRHRRDLARIDSGMRRRIDAERKAEEQRNRADNIEAAAAGAIYGDDADAIEQLEVRIAELEAKREQFKAHNREMRKPGACDHPADCDCRTAHPRECSDCTRHPLPGYVLQNLGGNIKRNRDRLGSLREQQARGRVAEKLGGVGIEPHRGGYVAVTFAEKPARDVLDALKGAGFHWQQGSWWGKADAVPAEVSSC